MGIGPVTKSPRTSSGLPAKRKNARLRQQHGLPANRGNARLTLPQALMSNLATRALSPRNQQTKTVLIHARTAEQNKKRRTTVTRTRVTRKAPKATRNANGLLGLTDHHRLGISHPPQVKKQRPEIGAELQTGTQRRIQRGFPTRAPIPTVVYSRR